MLFIALAWAFIGAFSIAVGLEKHAHWRIAINSRAAGLLRRLLLLCGWAASLSVIFLAFYTFVLSNALLVLFAWLLAFALTRMVLEIMGRKNIYLESDDVAREPEKETVKKKNLSRMDAAAAASPLMDPFGGSFVPVDPAAAADIADSAPEDISVPADETGEFADEDAPREDTSDLPEPMTKEKGGVKGMKDYDRGIPETPQRIEPGAPEAFTKEQAAEYNDVFDRLNADQGK